MNLVHKRQRSPDPITSPTDARVICAPLRLNYLPHHPWCMVGGARQRQRVDGDRDDNREKDIDGDDAWHYDIPPLVQEKCQYLFHTSWQPEPVGRQGQCRDDGSYGISSLLRPIPKEERIWSAQGRGVYICWCQDFGLHFSAFVSIHLHTRPYAPLINVCSSTEASCKVYLGDWFQGMMICNFQLFDLNWLPQVVFKG